jgi:hypothetical protein
MDVHAGMRACVVLGLIIAFGDCLYLTHKETVKIHTSYMIGELDIIFCKKECSKVLNRCIA